MFQKTKTKTGQAIEAAIGEARLRGAREIHFRDGEVVIVDHFRNETAVAIDGCTSEEVKSELARSDYWHDLPWNARDGEKHLPGAGRWTFTDVEEAAVLKAKKPFPPCLEAVADLDADDATALRSLYGDGGFDVYVACEGVERARAFASALAAERTLAGFPTGLVMTMPDGYGQYPRHEPRTVYSAANGNADSPAWEVSVLPSHAANPIVEDGWKGDGVRVTVVEASNYETRRIANATMRPGRARPVVLVTVTLDDSRPVAKIRLPDGVSPRLPAEGWTPWGEFTDRKAKLQASRPRTVKTWHPTTGHVARAFIERKAPRGFTGVDSLFFHGPVAFSLRTWNPIAAFVDMPNGNRPLLLMGRSASSPGGSKGGTISMAQGDVSTAARGRYEILHVDDLCDFVTWGGKPIDEVAAGMKHRKDEDKLPSSCKIDRRRLSIWLNGEKAKLEEAAETAMRTAFPTGRQAMAYASLARHAELRDKLAESTGANLPDMGDAEAFRAEEKRLRELVLERQANLEARRRQSKAEEEPETAGPRP